MKRIVGPPVRECRVCGKEFQPKTPSQAICGLACVRKMHSKMEVTRIASYKVARGATGTAS